MMFVNVSSMHFTALIRSAIICLNGGVEELLASFGLVEII